MKITVCGSTAFREDMEKLRSQLDALGHEVKIPELSLEAPEKFGGGKDFYIGRYVEENGGIDAFPPHHEIWGLKEAATNDHFEKIGWSDAILVVNNEKRGVAGYIGGATLVEIGLAFYLNKPIYILNPISSDLSYKQEIYGMRAILLDGDLSRLQESRGSAIAKADVAERRA